MDATFWQALSAISVIILAIGFFFAINKYLQFRRRDDAKLALDFFRDFRSDDFKAVIRSIYGVKHDAWNTLADYQRVRIDHLVDWFNLLGAVTRNREINENLAIETLGGPTAIRCWYRLLPYLRQETERRGFFCDDFEDFTRRSLSHFKHRGIPIWFSWGEEKVELVEHLQQPELKPRTIEEIRFQEKNRGN
ncbi:MAG: hypothetical protein P3T54_03010 [Dehalogenimonas sp.]|uniref:DUF4760 domain-containing protein n=1 Tax=Candidatus Dehalogenimonas loeffleri TaxID=3127115 RepID=A0ABZ2J1H9_9CHLR|nr:hypothetical protein [Dehalogenimonas sp.]